MVKTMFILLVAALIGLAVWVVVRELVDAPAAPVQEAAGPKTAWTAEEIAADPEGYMTWADARVQTQINDRQSRLTALSDRIADVERRQGTFLDKLKQTRNIHDRFTTAVRRAEDEDRWPVKIGGDSFDQAKARSIIEQAKRYIDDHQPLADAYIQALTRLQIAHSEMYRDIDQLKRLREKLALDLERVRLNQGIEELGRLRQTEQEIAGFAGALSQIADDAALLSLPSEDRPGQNTDLEKLIR